MIRSSDVASLEAALYWYATQPDEELAASKGSIARVAIAKHGSEEFKQMLEVHRREQAKNAVALKEGEVPEKPMHVLKKEPHPQDNLGVVAEIAPTSTMPRKELPAAQGPLMLMELGDC